MAWSSKLALDHAIKCDRILRERFQILKKAKDSPTYQLALKELCRRDIIFFINYFVSTFNPRVKPSLLPFILYPRQEEMLLWMLECIEKKTWGTVVKCRYTGASFVSMALCLWGFLFVPDFSAAIASNKRDLVDMRGSDGTLFYKIDMMYQSLPSWMKTLNWDQCRKNMLLRNPDNNSTIKGQSGKNIGRGDRCTVAFIDEAGHVEQDAEAVKALSETTDTAFLISTPNGKDNQHYLLTTRDAIPTFWYRWEADPRRSPKWRQEQTDKFGEEITAQELDCDFDASANGAFIEPKWIEACVDAHLKIEGLSEVATYRQAGLDVAAKGKDKTVLTIRDGCVVESIETLPANYPTQTALIVHQKIEGNVNALCFDGDGLGLDIAGAIDNFPESPSYLVIEFHGSAKAGDRQLIGLDDFTAKDVYFNARADAWGLLKERIKRTYEHVTGYAKHDLSELISIPNNEQLKLELSTPKYLFKGNKILIESKRDMRERGLPSPDMADSLAYAFYEDAQSVMWIMQL